MIEEMVCTRLYRLDRALRLTRPDPLRCRHVEGVSAALVIPRGGRLRAPRLMLFTGQTAEMPAHPGRLEDADAHTVAQYDESGHHDRRELADILIDGAANPLYTPAAARLQKVLDQYPGCGVVVGQDRTSYLAALQRGGAVRSAGGQQAVDLWPRLCGSFVHTWSVAGISMEDLASAVVIAGWLPTSADDPPHVLEVAGRVEFSTIHADALEELQLRGWREAS